MAKAVATIIAKSFVSALVVLITGCATTLSHGDKTWSKADVTQSQMRSDFASCRGEAERQRNRLAEDSGIVATFSENNRLEQIVFDCMTAKGYVLTNAAGSDRIK